MAQVRLSQEYARSPQRGVVARGRGRRVCAIRREGPCRMSDSGSLLHASTRPRVQAQRGIEIGKIASLHESGGGVRLRDSRPHRCARLGGVEGIPRGRPPEAVDNPGAKFRAELRRFDLIRR